MCSNGFTWRVLSVIFTSVSVGNKQRTQKSLLKTLRMKQERQLPQTDRASAFVVDRSKFFFTCGLITVQNLAVVSHTVCAHLGGPKIFGDAVPPWNGKTWLTPRNTLLPHLLTYLLTYLYHPIPNFVALSQTVRA